MANKRTISVNEASLVDLKAELYRKETQFKREKIENSKLPKKAPIWQRIKKESKKNVEKTLEVPPSDSSYDKEFEKSRLMLEAKSALYDKISSGEIEVPSDEEGQEGRFLVDFHQKTVPKENKNSCENEDENKIENSNEITPSASSSDEWVDYIDSFGRSRKCLRQDLPIMKEKDTKIKEKQDTSSFTLLSDDMRREIIRKKWEKEVEETMDKPVGPVHYQDVLFNETRDHGVGYYMFSKDEEERQEQQTALKKLRSQTEQQRNKREKLLEKRKAAMDARLAKVRERKLKKQGIAVDDIKETALSDEISKDEKIEGEPETSMDENEITGDSEDRIRNKIARMENSYSNDWEKRKINLEVFDKPKPKASRFDPQNERDPDFAPPSSYTVNKNENKSKYVDSNFQDNNTRNETKKTWESQFMNFDPAITSQAFITNYNNYPQETTNVPHISVSPYQPPTNIVPNLPPPNNTPPNLPPPTNIPPNLPPPTNIPPNLPPPTNIPHNLPPPPIHAFPPPFPTSNEYTNNISYPPPPLGVNYYPPVPPPGVHYYPPVPPPGYSFHPNSSSEPSPPGV